MANFVEQRAFLRWNPNKSKLFHLFRPNLRADETSARNEINSLNLSVILYKFLSFSYLDGIPHFLCGAVKHRKPADVRDVLPCKSREHFTKGFIPFNHSFNRGLVGQIQN